VTSEMIEHLPHGAVIRNWIGNRLYADEAISAISPCNEYATVVPLRLDLGLLNIMKAVGIIGPYVAPVSFGRKMQN